MQLDRVDIEIRPPGASSWTQITNQEHAANDALPISTLHVDWSRPTPRDPVAPGRIRFSLRIRPTSPHLALLAWDAEVRATVRSAHWSYPAGIVTIGYGWITGWTRDPKPDHLGRHTYHVDADDIFARVAATPIAAEPWPAQTRQQRIDAINAASPIGPIIVNGIPNDTTPVDARDVDNMSALELANLLCGLSHEYSAESHNQLRLRSNLHRQLTLGHSRATEVHARAVENTGLAMDRQGTITRVNVSGAWTTTAERVTRTYERNTDAPPAAWSTETDVVLDLATVGPWADAILDNSGDPAPRPISPARLVMDRLDHYSAHGSKYRGAELLDTSTRTRQVVAIIDPPPGVEDLYVVTGSTITVEGRHLTFSVTMMPASLFAIHAPRIRDLPHLFRNHPSGHHLPTFNDWATTSPGTSTTLHSLRATSALPNP